MSRAIRLAYKNVEIDGIDYNKVALVGISTVGHLSANFGGRYNQVNETDNEYNNIDSRPNAIILRYLVISSGEFAHFDLIEVLYEKGSEENRSYFCLENHVKGTTPLVFLWHVMDYIVVPVENSILYASACNLAGVMTEMHI